MIFLQMSFENPRGFFFLEEQKCKYEHLHPILEIVRIVQKDTQMQTGKTGQKSVLDGRFLSCPHQTLNDSNHCLVLLFCFFFSPFSGMFTFSMTQSVRPIPLFLLFSYYWQLSSSGSFYGKFLMLGFAMSHYLAKVQLVSQENRSLLILEKCPNHFPSSCVSLL